MSGEVRVPVCTNYVGEGDDYGRDSCAFYRDGGVCLSPSCDHKLEVPLAMAVAAPKMYEALASIADYYNEHGQKNPTLAKVNAILAEARSES